MSGNIMFGIPLICFLLLIIGIIKPKWVIRWGNIEKRNRKKVFIYYGKGFVITIILSNFLFDTYGYDYTSTEKYNASSYDTGITYDQIARTPQNYTKKKVRFSGTVFQVLESNGRTQLRMTISSNVNNVIIVEYKTDVLKQRFLENDNITVSGRFIDIWSSTSTKGQKMNDPAIWADNIDLNNLKTK